MTSISYLLGTKTPEEAVGRVEELGAEALARVIVNDALNGLIANRDGGGIFGEADPSKMHIPYAGWYWRSVDFFAEYGVTIAEADGQTVVCENNKWGYDQRSLTDPERAEFLRLVWAAYQTSRAGGQLSEIHAKTDKALAKAGAFIAGLDVFE